MQNSLEVAILTEFNRLCESKGVSPVNVMATLHKDPGSAQYFLEIDPSYQRRDIPSPQRNRIGDGFDELMLSLEGVGFQNLSAQASTEGGIPSQFVTQNMPIDELYERVHEAASRARSGFAARMA